MMETEQATNNDAVMYRRLKNRERQRRYRARKRLEADKKKANTSSPVPVPVPVPVLVEMKVEHVEATKKLCNGLNTSPSAPVSVENYVTRVHCRRDWKKDARMAHKTKKEEEEKSLDTAIGLVQPVDSGLEANNIERSIQPSRRRWKADARNRNTEVVTASASL